MDGIEHFYAQQIFRRHDFYWRVTCQVIINRTPYKQIMNILRRVSHKVKKFDTLYDIPSVTNYYNELIEEAYETEMRLHKYMN